MSTAVAMKTEGDDADISNNIKVEEGQPRMRSADDDTVKPTYKSFKKKYRKMRIKFDEKMRQSNHYYMEEQAAIDTARRLAQENDRLLDLLLDVNNSAQIPAYQRFDISLDTPPISAVPGLIPAEDLTKTIDRSTPAGQTIYDEIQSILKEKAADMEAARIPPAPPNASLQSLADLMQMVPHHTLSSPLVSPELLASLETTEEGHTAPISYLTLDQIDEYLYDVDATIQKGAAPAAFTETRPQYLDLAMRNPYSVYNWLRRHEPKIFLQDGEGSEKSLGKPGALRGAGKRASIPAPSKPDALEIVEEDGMSYDVSLGGTQGGRGGPAAGKRKREDDDGYAPKKRNSIDDPKPKKPRQYRKKNSEGSSESTAPAKKGKGKGKAKASSPILESKHETPIKTDRNT